MIQWPWTCQSRPWLLNTHISWADEHGVKDRTFRRSSICRPRCDWRQNQRRFSGCWVAIYNQSGNRIRGRIYLEKAVSEDSQDVDSLLMLGRLLGEQGEWSDAIVALAYAGRLDEAQSDRAMEKSLRYYLGYALDHEGFDMAAITQLETYLALPVDIDRTSRMLRQMMVLNRQRSAAWQTVGDAYNRLGRPADGLLAYRRAIGHGIEPSAALIRRLVFTSLRLGRHDVAVQALQEYVQAARADDVSLSLVRYLNECGVDRDGLAAMLRGVYSDGERSSSLTLAIAALLDPVSAGDFLTTHVRQRPADRSVFETLVTMELSAKTVDVEQVGRILETTIVLIDQLPSAAQEYTTILVKAAGKGENLVDAIDSLPISRRRAVSVRFIRSKALARSGRIEQAIEELERVAEGELHWKVARIELASLLVDRGDLERADELLDTLPTPLDLAAVKLRLAVFHRGGDSAEAIRFLDELLARHPPNRVDLVVEKATLQLLLGDALQAQATLQQALEAHPRSPQLYEQLLELYRLKRLPDTGKQYEHLVVQMLRMIPHERVARVERAKLELRDGRYDQAEPLLRALLAEDPSDLKPLDPMLLLLIRTDRHAEAESMISERLEVEPTNRSVLTAALRHYHRVENSAILVEVARRYLIELFKDTPRNLREIDFLMELLVKNDQQDLAETLLETAKADHPADRVLLLSAIRHYDRIGDKQRLFESTEQWLLLDPPSLKRSRDLGILYLNHERHEQAIEVLQKASDKPGPEVPQLVGLLARALASVDRFEEAEEQFRTAIERFPQQGSDLKYEWAIHHHRYDNWQRSEEILLDLLTANPRHAPANNFLGYAWADRGVQLDRAQEMIRAALEVNGDDMAYLDSMGWVLYKLGKFKEAVVWLQRSNAAPGGDYPVILNHLGDALFRVGRSKPAMVMWRRAERGVDQYSVADDRELEGLGQRVRHKIEAVEAGKPPEVAKVPSLEPEQPADEPNQAVVVPNDDATE